MRKIRFRAKTLKEGKWIYGFYAHFVDSFRGRETHRIFSGMADSDPEDFFPTYDDIDPTVMSSGTAGPTNDSRRTRAIPWASFPGMNGMPAGASKALSGHLSVANAWRCSGMFTIRQIGSK